MLSKSTNSTQKVNLLIYYYNFVILITIFSAKYERKTLKVRCLTLRNTLVFWVKIAEYRLQSALKVLKLEIENEIHAHIIHLHIMTCYLFWRHLFQTDFFSRPGTVKLLSMSIYWRKTLN